MRNKINVKILQVFCLLLCLFIFSSCEEEVNEHYDIPGWLKGNAKQVLESKGNFTVFLDAVERVGYTDMISGKGIITVIAPTDEAFNTWLGSHGYASLNDVPQDELEKLVTFHLVYYSFSKQMFANYRPEGNMSEETVASRQTAGLYYKFRTKSKDQITTENDPTVNPGSAAVSRKVYHYERFLPVFSSYLFSTKGIDPAYNYEYFYPGSTWTGGNGGFNISNASVNEYAVVADNGYVYTVDKVLEPLETIRTGLLESPDYSTFIRMYDRFVSFQYNSSASADYGNGDSLFLRSYRSLPPIAYEWTTTDYSAFNILARNAYNVFAPNNASMQSFFDSFWSTYYSSIDEVPFIPMLYLLYNHVTGNGDPVESTGNDIVFPEEISQGKVISPLGNAIEFDPNTTNLRKICANGSLYGLTNVLVPRVFQSVTAPLFRNPEYKAFLWIMNYADKIISLMTDNATFALFIPKYANLIDNSTINSWELMYENTNVNLYGSESVKVDGEAGFTTLTYSRAQKIANTHIGVKLLSHVGSDYIYKTLEDYQYIYVNDEEGKAYSSLIWNSMREKAPDVSQIYTAYNGTTYELSGVDGMALLAEESYYRDLITKSTPADFVAFKNLLVAANLQLTAPPFNFLQDRFISLIPSADAIAAGQAAGKIPTAAADLANYLKYYYINVNSSLLNDYPFPGANIQGEANTFLYKNGAPLKLTVIDTGTKVQIKDAKGNVVNIVSVFPNIYADGAAYLIDGLLEFE